MFAQPEKIEEDGLGGASMDAMLKDRNENWAGQIEAKVMKGAGCSLTSPSAVAIVGPDSLLDRLELRGIEAVRSPT